MFKIEIVMCHTWIFAPYVWNVRRSIYHSPYYTDFNLFQIFFRKYLLSLWDCPIYFKSVYVIDNFNTELLLVTTIQKILITLNNIVILFSVNFFPKVVGDKNLRSKYFLTLFRIVNYYWNSNEAATWRFCVLAYIINLFPIYCCFKQMFSLLNPYFDLFVFFLLHQVFIIFELYKFFSFRFRIVSEFDVGFVFLLSLSSILFLLMLKWCCWLSKK